MACFAHLSDGYAPDEYFPVGVDSYGGANGAAMDDNGLWYAFLNPNNDPEGRLRTWTFPNIADTDPYVDVFDWSTFDSRTFPCVEPDGSRVYALLPNSNEIEAIDLPGGTPTTLYTASAGTVLRNLVKIDDRLYFGEVHEPSSNFDPDQSWTSELRYVTTDGLSSGVLYSDSDSDFPRKTIFDSEMVTTLDGAVWGRIRQVAHVGFSFPVTVYIFRYDTGGASFAQTGSVTSFGLFARPTNEVSFRDNFPTQYRVDASLTITTDTCDDILAGESNEQAHDSSFAKFGYARFSGSEVWGIAARSGWVVGAVGWSS